MLDTPPSRDALDFLDAPDRLTQFLEGRALKVLMAPGGVTRGLVGRGAGLDALGVRARHGRQPGRRAIGFFGSLAGLTDGFRERARGVEQLLRDPVTGFLIVTSPEHEPAREAVFLHAQLVREADGVRRLDRQPFSRPRTRRAHAGADRATALGRARRDACRARGGESGRLRRARAARPRERRELCRRRSANATRCSCLT